MKKILNLGVQKVCSNNYTNTQELFVSFVFYFVAFTFLTARAKQEILGYRRKTWGAGRSPRYETIAQTSILY